MADKSIFERSVDPVHQALAVFAAGVLITLLGKLAQVSGMTAVSPLFPWMTAASFMLLFAVFNAVLSVASPNMMKYWGRSIYSFMGLALASGLVAWLFSSLSIDQAGSYRWIFIVVTFGYIVFLGMMAFLKNIIEFAQREEWNHPRLRNRDQDRKR